jgi:NTP pyrophosphatase (non-canonical NTP hydrolase)
MGNDHCLACAIEHTVGTKGISDTAHTCEKGTDTSTATGSAYTFDNYQQDTGTTAIYPNAGLGTADAITYTILGLIGEGGEIANKWKKFFRDNDPNVYPSDAIEAYKSDIAKELGDVLWYASQLAIELGINLGDVAADNIRKLQARKASGTIHGSGDNR